MRLLVATQVRKFCRLCTLQGSFADYAFIPVYESQCVSLASVNRHYVCSTMSVAQLKSQCISMAHLESQCVSMAHLESQCVNMAQLESRGMSMAQLESQGMNMAEFSYCDRGHAWNTSYCVFSGSRILVRASCLRELWHINSILPDAI